VKIHEAKELVERWIDERVEIDSEVVTSSYDAFGDFLKWIQRQRGRGGGVTVDQFDSAMKNNDFDLARNFWSRSKVVKSLCEPDLSLLKISSGLSLLRISWIWPKLPRR
jgi:hypothetical protein